MLETLCGTSERVPRLGTAVDMALECPVFIWLGYAKANISDSMALYLFPWSRES
jgi:hypothetical protein